MVTPPVATAIAFISDVHGNLSALEAVLDELKRRDVARIYAAGDLLLGGDAPLDVWRLLQRHEVQCIRGLSEEALLRIDSADLTPDGDEEFARADAFLETRRALGELVITQIRKLPQKLRIPLIDGREILMVHGSPVDPWTEIAHDASDDELLTALGSDAADVVVCGASHVAFRKDLEGVAIISVGSVGAAPTSGVAHFCVMRPRMDGLEVLLDHLEY